MTSESLRGAKEITPESIERNIQWAVERAAEIYPEMEAKYMDFHENPELGGQEIETSRKVAEYLESLGIEIVGRNIGLTKEDTREKKEGFDKTSVGTGVVAIIRGTPGGKTVALRADMDALPVKEDPANPVKSKFEGKMHACGHDIHTTALLGAAKILKEMADKGELPGDVVLMFQPSEEKTHQKESGAVQMVKFLQTSGLRSRIDAFFGQHVYSQQERGTVNVKEGIQSSSSGEVDIRLEGKGGHVIDIFGGEVANLNVIFSEIHTRLHKIFKPLFDKNKSIVASTRTDFEMPGGYNVIPSSGESTFVVRISDENYRPIAQSVLAQIKAVVEEVVQEYAPDKVNVKISPRMGYRPIVHRDEKLVAITRQSGKQVVSEPVFTEEFMPGGEDYSFYLEELRGRQIPGVFAMVGGANSKKGIPKVAHHARNFKVDPEVLKEMSALHVAFSLNFLSQPTETL